MLVGQARHPGGSAFCLEAQSPHNKTSIEPIFAKEDQSRMSRMTEDSYNGRLAAKTSMAEMKHADQNEA